MATRQGADANRRAAARARPPGGPGSSGRRTLLVAGGVVVLAAAVAIAVSVATGEPDRPGALEDRAAAVAVEGAPLPPLPDAGRPDPAVGAPFPTLRGTGADGEPLTIDGSRPMILVLLAHWCPVCQREVPVLVDWLAAGGPEGVDVLALSSSFAPARGNWPSTEWLSREGWEQPTLLDPDDSAFSAVGGRAFPGFVVVGPDGTVVARTAGELGIDQLEALAALARGGTG